MSAQCTYTVKETKVTKITLHDIEVAVGGEVAIEYTTEPVMVPVERITFKSSKPNIAVTSAGGTVIGVTDGTATITATCGDVQASCTVKVGTGIIHVQNVKVTPAGIADYVSVGATKKLSVTIEPEDATYQTVTWTSSNTSVATVSSDGTVTCKGEGSCVITAKADGKTGTCNVTYSQNIIHVTSVTVSPSTYTADANIGSIKKLTATVKPDNATDKSVAWKSSNTAVATVSNDGTVTCKGVGTATITATADGKSGTCSVTFEKVRVTSVKLSSTTCVENAVIGSTKKLTATVLPDNATDKTVSWSSSNTSVATVSHDGTVTCKAAGNAIITATADGKSATCSFTYNKVSVSSVTVSPSEYTHTVSVGDTRQLRADVLPANATYKDVTWTSSNTAVVTVSSTGRITCKGVGTATVTATADGKSGTCTITYKDEPVRVESVSLNKSALHLLSVGGRGMGSEQLTATVKPDNATYKDVTWTSSNSSVASVSTSGVVIGRTEGTATITATADGKSAKCTVNVQAGAMMTDCEGNSYVTVKIDGVWIMAENLRCRTYDSQSNRPGVKLGGYEIDKEYEPHYVDARDRTNWNSVSFSDNLSNSQVQKLGYLYSWAAAVGLTGAAALNRKTGFNGNRQGICPNGWHVPNIAEWVEFTDSDEHSGDYYKTTSGWYNDGNGRDTDFLSVLPSGNGLKGDIVQVGSYAYFWTATPMINDEFSRAQHAVYRYDKSYGYTTESRKSYEFAIRCIKD